MRVVDRLQDYAQALRHQAFSLIPRRWRTPAASPRCPIVLIPGVWENSRYLHGLSSFLSSHGYPVYTVPSLRWTTGNIATLGNRIARFIDEKRLHDVVLVAHSKGGLIAKQVLLTDQEQRVRGCVALCTPFSGSKWAALFLPGWGIRSLRPGHPSIRRLRTQREVNAKIISIYPREDPHVPEGSYLEGAADNVELNTTGHFRVLDQPATRTALLAAIAHLTT